MIIFQFFQFFVFFTLFVFFVNMYNTDTFEYAHGKRTFWYDYVSFNNPIVYECVDETITITLEAGIFIKHGTACVNTGIYLQAVENPIEYYFVKEEQNAIRVYSNNFTHYNTRLTDVVTSFTTGELKFIFLNDESPSYVTEEEIEIVLKLNTHGVHLADDEESDG